MLRHIVTLLISGSFALPAHGAEVYRWVDGDGRVHYGDSIPEQYKNRAKKADQNYFKPTDAQRQEAEARAASDKARVDAINAQQGKPGGPPATPPASNAAPPLEARKKCEEEWRKYLASHACFAKYRNVGGSIRGDAFKECADVKEPAQCDPPFVIPPPTFINPDTSR